MSARLATDFRDRVFDPLTDCLTPEVASRIVALRADPQTQAILDDLADKANEGLLTEQERADYEEYRRVLCFIAILQAKSRRIVSNK